MEIKKLEEIIKLAAFDVDETLLPNGYTKFSENTKSIFQSLNKKGIKTVISTAREFATIGDFLEQLYPVDYFMGANGAFIWDVQNKKFIFKNTLKRDQVIKLYNEFGEKVRGFAVSDFDKIYNSKDMNLNTWFIKPFAQNYHAFDPDLIGDEDLYLITITSSENLKELYEEFKDFISKNKLDMEISSRWSRGFFINPLSVNKSTTLKFLLNKLELNYDNLISFGDSSNDFEMIRDAYYGVAMQRAGEKIKAVANDIALDSVYDGVYLKLKELKLI
ncbi:YcsE-related riboflavin metabolism phosphatase [Mycoplasma sp. CSL7503-lung]|uniref:YcsE-related riboflavin metabolism phosphatase n=1 Tax=Mycoplasma sp. CSL7503-lung TaxID=536372 RepID=UPI0021D21C7C|nr:HAD family hydrolase [Mycoplasma sp. CSL7503-lung]MCU4706794.1 Cof-type HAD-IIB family hydrolase [Mycoplasma sp. CSL7503-lung]